MPWKNIVWQKRGIPKYKTLTWLFVLDRCPTRNGLLAWGLQTDAGCLFCNREPESRGHLFFCCDYPYSVWGTLARKLNLSLSSNSWTDSSLFMRPFWRHWMSLSHDPGLASINLWNLERKEQQAPPQYLQTVYIDSSSINSTIKNRISSFRDVNTAFSSNMMQFWLSLKSKLKSKDYCVPANSLIITPCRLHIWISSTFGVSV